MRSCLLSVLFLCLPAAAAATDLRPIEVLSPKPVNYSRFEQVWSPVTPEFVIENANVQAAAEYSVIVEIRSLPNNAQVYRGTVAGTRIEAFSKLTLKSSEPWFPLAPGDYIIRLAVLFDFDIMPENNIKEWPFKLCRGPSVQPPETQPGNVFLQSVTEGASASVTFSMNMEQCCWNISAGQILGNLSGILRDVSPKSGQCVFGKPLTFTFTTATGAFDGLLPYLDELKADVYFTVAPCDEPDKKRTVIVGLPVKRKPAQSASPPQNAVIAETPNAGTTADPISTLTGEYFDDPPPDLALYSPMPLAFRRFYGSRLGAARDGLPKPLGENWSHAYLFNFQWFGSRVFLTTPRGRRLVFRNQSGVWASPKGLEQRVALAAQAGAFYFRDYAENKTYRFDSTGALTGVADKHGREIRVFGVAGKVDSLRDGFGNSLRLTYDSGGNLTQVRDNAGRTVRFTVSGGELTSFADAEGMTYRYEYEPGKTGLLTAILYPEGNRPYRQNFNAAGRTTAQTPASGMATSLEIQDSSAVIRTGADEARHTHDLSGNLVRYADQEGGVITTGYTAAGNIATLRDRRGAAYSAGYNPATGMMTALEFPEGEDFSFEYRTRTLFGLPLYDQTKATDAAGAQHIFEYDANGYLTGYRTAPPTIGYTLTNSAAGLPEKTTLDAAGVSVTTTYRYGANGLPAEITAANGVQRFGYDATGRVVKHTLPNGRERVYEYSALRLRAVTDENGVVHRYDYDNNGRPTRLTRNGMAILTLTYDALNRIETADDASGKPWRRVYDQLGRIAAVVSPAGDSFRMNYDKTHKLTGMTDAAGRQWGVGADGEAVTRLVTTPNGDSWNYETDSFGKVVRQTLPGGAARTIEYDAAGRPVALGDEFGLRTAMDYAPNGKPSVLRLNDSLTLRLGYNGAGRIATITDPNNSAWNILYSADGQLAGYRDPLGAETTFGRDATGRIATVRLPGNAGNVAVSYTPDGLIATQTSGAADSINYVYDVTRQPVAATGFTAGYDARGAMTASNGIAIERDAEGRITAIIPAAGKRVEYRYDNTGRLTTVSDWAGGSVAFGYDAGGRLVSASRANGIATTYTLDAAGRLAGLREGVIASLNLAREPSGRIISAERRYPLAAKVGNAENAASYDAASRNAEFTYDARGNLTRDGERTYEWDAAGRLRGITRNGERTRFNYDAFGRFVSKISPKGDTIRYVWNYATQIPSVSAEITKLLEQYIITTPEGLPVATVDAAGKHTYFHYDEQGNTTLHTDDEGKVSGIFAYSPFGEILAQNAAPEDMRLYRGSSGTLTDRTIGLCFMQSRWYDPAAGRFLSRDSHITPHPNESNPYSYARNSPTLYHDPAGTDARVNFDGIHTDITVDVWDGNSIIGTLNASWGDGGGSGAGSGARLANAVSTTGSLKLTFVPGVTVHTQPRQNSKEYVFITGTQQQDKNLLDGIIRYVETVGAADDPRVKEKLDFLNDITDPANRKRAQGGVVTSDGLWNQYRFFTNSCNDVTDGFLDIYFGENWYFGSIYDAGSMKYNLKKYLLANSIPGCGAGLYLQDRAFYLFPPIGFGVDLAKGVIFGLGGAVFSD